MRIGLEACATWLRRKYVDSLPYSRLVVLGEFLTVDRSLESHVPSKRTTFIELTPLICGLVASSVQGI